MENKVHEECINASNPYHVCVEYCYQKIAEARQRRKQEVVVEAPSAEAEAAAPSVDSRVDESAGKTEDAGEDKLPENFSNMSETQKRLFQLRLKMNEARKANQSAIVEESKRKEAPREERGVSKQKWFEGKQKVIGKRLESSGLDPSKAYMLDTQESAETKYKKWERKPAPFGWDVFNQRSLYKAYKKRTKNIETNMKEEEESGRSVVVVEYGKSPHIPQHNMNRMVEELQERAGKRKEFSRRRKFHEEKDIDSINDRNEHFNRKIERAFGKYTVEIKNNLERGTALPD